MFCKHCGKNLPDDAVFCSYCGANQNMVSDNCSISNSGTNEDSILPNNRIDGADIQPAPLAAEPSIAADEKAIGKKKKLTKILIGAVCIAVAIIIGIIWGVKSNNDKQNAFSLGVNSSDYTYIFDDSDGKNVISTITPKYDFKEFSIKITYYAEKGLLNYYEEEYNIGEVRAGAKIKYTKSISDIEKKINGSFYYASASTVSGKKQYKNYTNPQEAVYNDECAFKFKINYNYGNLSFDIDITNNTNYYISELRAFRVTIDYESNKKCSFYTTRIKLQNKLAPGGTITVKNLTGNTTHNGMDSASSPYTSSTYSAPTYQVVYA